MDDLAKLKLLAGEDGETGGGGPCPCPAAQTAPGAACETCGACPGPGGACPGPGGAGSPRRFTDEELVRLLELHDGDVYAAAYDALLRKAESSALSLPGGARLPDQRAYWLSRARAVRPNATKAVGRADGT